MKEMTTHQRYSRTFEHLEADRVPIIDYPWDATLKRWYNEGMPQNLSYIEYFDIDRIAYISMDNSPLYERRVIEETEEYLIETTQWGATVKQLKNKTSTPEFLDFTIKNQDTWLSAKKRMLPSKERIDWTYLKENYKTWRQQGYWIEAGLWFGFDATHSWIVGTERVLMAIATDPGWLIDIFNHCLDVHLKLLDMIWDAGYHFHSIIWPDDMGYKNNQFFSVDTYRSLLKPVHKRAVDWAHAHKIKAQIHSCGDINPFIPELIEIGIDALNPLEVKAGMDPINLKKTYGEQLVLCGGINSLLYDDFDALEAQVCKTLPVMKQSGGYIFSSDHSVPSNVSLKKFGRLVELAKSLGSYH